MVKVGIPRGLLYYYYHPIWKTFFEKLGVKVVVSPKTNKKILNRGVENTIDEICLPVKIFNGHIAEIKDKVNYILVPRIMSIENKQWICPKFQGLPEIIKSTFRKLPKTISPVIDFNDKKYSTKKVVYEVGGLFTKDIKKIENAFVAGLNDYNHYQTLIKEYEILPSDILSNNFSFDLNLKRYRKPKILVLGHPYLIYDEFINMNLIKKLRAYNFNIITEDNIADRVTSDALIKAKIDMYWTFGRKILGSMLYCINSNIITGIVYISSFTCGLDSVITEILERRTRRESKIPYMLITIDEHTGEAGINTRIEAFADMVLRRGEF